MAHEHEERIKEILKELDISEKIPEIMRLFAIEIDNGLKKATHDNATIKCFITYVQDLPNGTETGKFLALDLGGTNFRVLLITLKGENDFDMQSKIYAIPNTIMIGSGQQLFDHIATCLSTFMKEHSVYTERLPLGFTFSFPLRQLGLTKGTLERWTKGFNCSGVVGEDVVQLLKDAIARRGDIEIEVCGILNDTTGTLMSCAWKNHNCKVGAIVGTGSNACYVEKVANCELFDGADNGKEHVLINTEWGAFGDNGVLDFARTEYDREIDEHSINPGKQKQEKMISGMYMGEIARLILAKLVEERLILDGNAPDALFKRGQFFTKYVSEIESDKPKTYNNCRDVLEEFGIMHASDQDCEVVRMCCEAVSKRAADLVSAGISSLINRMDEKSVTVGVDGSVYRFHPKFHSLMMTRIREHVKPEIQFDLMLSEDGSGRGAALVAAVASRDEKK